MMGSIFDSKQCQLDAVSDLSDDNAEIRQKIFNAYQEEPERGADMIIPIKVLN